MNMDADTRMLPRGEYRLLENGRVVDTDSDHSGVVESLSGTKLLACESLVAAGFEVIGMYSSDHWIFYFVCKNDVGTAIVRYDVNAGKQEYVLLDMDMDMKDEADGYMNTLCYLKNK